MTVRPSGDPGHLFSSAWGRVVQGLTPECRHTRERVSVVLIVKTHTQKADLHAAYNLISQEMRAEPFYIPFPVENINLPINDFNKMMSVKEKKKLPLVTRLFGPKNESSRVAHLTHVHRPEPGRSLLDELVGCNGGGGGQRASPTASL